jgi:hypothetical protein
MRGGTIDRAAEKDIRMWMEKGECPPPDELEELCETVGNPKCIPGCD